MTFQSASEKASEAKSPWCQLCVRPFSEGLVVVLRLTEVIHCRVQTVLAAFR